MHLACTRLLCGDRRFWHLSAWHCYLKEPMLMCLINSESISLLASSVLMRDFFIIFDEKICVIFVMVWFRNCWFKLLIQTHLRTVLSYKLKMLIWDLINHCFSVGRRHCYKINHPVIPQRLYHQNICSAVRFFSAVCLNSGSKHNIKSGKHILLVSYFPAGCFTLFTF